MSFLAGLISFAVLAAAVPILVRALPRRNAIGTIVAAALAVHVIGTITFSYFLGELDYWQSASLYWFAAICLIYAYGTCYRSLSIQMLAAIARSRTAIETQQLYDAHFKTFVQDRIDALVEGGRARFQAGHLVITPQGRSDAGLILFARRVFGLTGNRLYFGRQPQR